MADFNQTIVNQLCKVSETLEKIELLTKTREKRDTDIVFITIPENASVGSPTRSFAIGTTKINFKNGTIINPNGTVETLQTKLDAYKLDWLHSLSIDADQAISIKLDGKPRRAITANFSTQIPYLTYYNLEIECTVVTNIQIFACTNPSAVIGQFKGPVNMTQTTIDGDTSEATTWDSVTSLLNNLNKIRNQIITITGEAWGTVSHSIATVWAKFHATTGHKHTGAADDAPLLDNNSVASSAAIAMSKLNLAITNNEVAAGAAIAASKLESGIAKITSSSYAGNNTQNRAVAHGLGRTPQFIFAFASAGQGWAQTVSGYHAWLWSDAKSVTGWDNTNFYIGQASGFNGNESGLTYYWIAIG